MRCHFAKDGDWCVCQVCGYSVRGADCDKVLTNCPGQPTYRKPPTLAQQAVHYISAVAGHITGGLRSRTDDEVDRLLEICRGCEHFLPESSSCGVCGCRCNRSASAWVNKLRMVTQKCPKGKWA